VRIKGARFDIFADDSIFGRDITASVGEAIVMGE
jgi:hypothetical protein